MMTSNKFAFGAFLLLTSSIAFATPSEFNITSKVFIDGKLISSPHLIVRVNQPATVVILNDSGTEKLKLDVIANDAVAPGIQDAIKMNFDIHYVNGDNKFHSKPVFVVAPRQEGNIYLSQSGHSFEMYVQAVRE